jgi:hypothetical protein
VHMILPANSHGKHGRDIIGTKIAIFWRTKNINDIITFLKSGSYTPRRFASSGLLVGLLHGPCYGRDRARMAARRQGCRFSIPKKP